MSLNLFKSLRSLRLSSNKSVKSSLPILLWVVWLTSQEINFSPKSIYSLIMMSTSILFPWISWVLITLLLQLKELSSSSFISWSNWFPVGGHHVLLVQQLVLQYLMKILMLPKKGIEWHKIPVALTSWEWLMCQKLSRECLAKRQQLIVSVLLSLEENALDSWESMELEKLLSLEC